jgi:RND family efflux transporter MFP subunit
MQSRFARIYPFSCLLMACLVATGCEKKPAAAAGPPPQGFPVQTVTVTMSPVAQSSEYVATVKSRRSATLQPQVNGTLTEILAKSGDHVKAGQLIMQIDPRQQQAAMDAQRATERQKKSLFDYNAIEVDRQHKLFDAGVTSRDTYDQAQQAYDNSKADYESSVESRKNQEQLLGYFTIRAPFDGIVGDIPVHVGDYVTTSTMLTTVDENKDLEAYIDIPTERAGQIKVGLPVELTDTAGNLLEKTQIDFLSPEVDSNLQGILAKAPVHATAEMVRHSEIVKARVIWDTKPKAVVPVLAISRLGGQTFVYVAEDQGGKFFAKQRLITVGDTVGNDYAVENGLKAGDKVIVSGTQFLMDGAPVMPLPPGPPGPPQAESTSGAGI